jgi:hypothetical protein
MTDAFAAVHTFTARLQTTNGDVLVDYVSPNLVRLRIFTEEAVLAGDRTYARTAAGWREVFNYKEGQVARDLVLQPRIVPLWARAGHDIVVTAARKKGVPLHLYRYFSIADGAQMITTIAVNDATHLPDYAVYDTQQRRTVVEYLSYNRPPAFVWPPP